jgi:hypothetical protein
MVSGKSYMRLVELSLDTLDERRQQANMVMVHTKMHGKSQLDHTFWFEKAMDGQKGHQECSTNFFSEQVIERWNRISATMKRVAKNTTFL